MKLRISMLIMAAAFAVNAQLVPTNPPASVVLAWDAPATSEVAGYNVYWGAAPRYYTNLVTTANLTATISNLERGTTYYFAATAFSAAGLESEFSNEVSYTPPARPIAPVLRLSIVDGWRLQGQAEPYQTYRLQRSNDLATWATVRTVTADRNGEFVCAVAGIGRSGFYRTAL